MRLTIFILVLIGSLFAGNSYTTKYSTYGYNSASRISKIVNFIALQLSQNKDMESLTDSPMAITSFVNLEDFKDTNKFGNIIAENLVHDLYVRGFNIIDFKVMPYIEIDRHGDFVFSRKLEELKGKNVKIRHLVSGTWSYYSDGISLSVRIIDVDTHAVVSSAKAFVKREDVQDILSSGEKLYKINKKSDQIISKVLKDQKKSKELEYIEPILERKIEPKKIKIDEKEPDANLIL